MPAMLRHKPTGDLYIFTNILSRRADMEEVDPAVIEAEKKAAAAKAAKPQPVVKKAAPKKKAAAKKAEPAPAIEEPAPEVEDDDPSSTGLAADLFGE